MKKRNFISNNKNQKRLYLILIGLAIVSIIIGIIFIFFISNDNKTYIKESLNNYFNNQNTSINYFFKSLFNNFIYVIVIWVLGISIIGIPIIIFMYLFKSFLLGFSISSIINSYGLKGILISLIDILPGKFLYLIIILLISFYSLSFSLKIIKNLFFKRPVNFRESMNKYSKILVICLISSLLITIYQVFIESILLKLL